MYCYTYVNNYKCIFNELMLWCEISSEHPTFIKTVADFSKINLSQDTVDKLMEVKKMFSDLREDVSEIKRLNPYMNFQVRLQLITHIRRFLEYDIHFLEVLNEVKQYDKDDKVWQTLLEHITHEQKFMYELFTNIIHQLG